jgi:hypothetical protein
LLRSNFLKFQPLRRKVKRIHTDLNPQTLQKPGPLANVADPGSGAFLTPWIRDPGSGMGKNQDPDP